MLEKNLWGQLPIEDEIRTPTHILKEQATILTDMTKGVLQGEVSVGQDGGRFELNLYIVAPRIENYTFTVAWCSHGLDLYPVRVNPGWDRAYTARIECANEEEFESALKSILSSDKVRRVVSTLLGQSRAT